MIEEEINKKLNPEERKHLLEEKGFLKDFELSYNINSNNNQNPNPNQSQNQDESQETFLDRMKKRIIRY